MSKFHFVCVAMVITLTGCSTSGSTDPRRDDLVTSIKCSLTADCSNFNEDKERDLEAEREESRRLEAEARAAQAELAASQSAIDELNQSLAELDASIVSLKKKTEAASLESQAKKDEIAGLKRTLDDMEKEAAALESDVLKETISVNEAQLERDKLVNRRQELESLLEEILSSQ